MKNLRILLDVDEVLADFVGGALRAHGWTREQLEAVWPAGTWSIVEPMGLTVEEFWRPIHAAGESFWTSLDRHPWVDELLRTVQDFTDDWLLVTSPSADPSSYSGKVRWINDNLGVHPQHIVLTNRKEIMANHSTVLIDDRASSIQSFISAGGLGIAFPSRHNHRHLLANDPVSHI